MMDFKGLLCHHSEDKWGDERDQLVVPSKHRREIIEMAHGAKLSAHLGNKFTKKILVTSTAQESLEMSPLSARHVRDVCEDPGEQFPEHHFNLFL